MLQLRRKNVTVVAVVLILSFAVRSHWVAAESTESQATVAAAILAREKGRNDAMCKQDAVYLNNLCTDDATNFVDISPDVQFSTKNWREVFQHSSEIMHHYVSGMTREHVQLYGDAAVLTYRQTFLNDEDSNLHYANKVTVVFVRQQGIWKEAHRHTTAIPDRPIVPSP